MTIIITSALRNGLTERGHTGFIQVFKAVAHPKAMELRKKQHLPHRSFVVLLWGIVTVGKDVQDLGHPRSILSRHRQVLVGSRLRTSQCLQNAKAEGGRGDLHVRTTDVNWGVITWTALQDGRDAF